MDDLKLFAQIVKPIPRSIADPIVKQHRGDKVASKLRSRNQMLCLLFCYLEYSMSLRDTTNGICSAGGDLSHLEISAAPSRNTLSHQDKVRPCIIRKELCPTSYRYLG